MEFPSLVNIKEELLDGEEQVITPPWIVIRQNQEDPLALPTVKQEVQYRKQETLANTSPLQDITMDIVSKVKVEPSSSSSTVKSRINKDIKKYNITDCYVTLDLLPNIKKEMSATSIKVKIETEENNVNMKENKHVILDLLPTAKNENLYLDSENCGDGNVGSNSDDQSEDEGVVNMDSLPLAMRNILHSDSENSGNDNMGSSYTDESKPGPQNVGVKVSACGQLNKDGSKELTLKKGPEELQNITLEEEFVLEKCLFFCNDCDFSSGSKFCLLKHTLTHKQYSSKYTKNKLGTCPYCEYKYAKSYLELHIRSHTGERPFKCNLCDCLYRSSQTLNHHIMSKHTSISKFKCRICKYETNMSSSFRYHKVCHNRVKSYSCSKCDLVFRSLIILQRHFKRKHIKEKAHKCGMCNFRCALKFDLTFHMKKHTGEKKYSCDHCGCKFVASGVLKSHIISKHTTEKYFKCTKCNFQSKYQMSVTIHMRTHTGEKPYMCKLCNYKSAQNSNLRSHMKTHTGEKPFSCPHCDFKVSHQANLKSHMKTHSENRPISCKLCPSKFTNTRYLKIHMRKFHLE